MFHYLDLHREQMNYTQGAYFCFILSVCTYLLCTDILLQKTALYM